MSNYLSEVEEARRREKGKLMYRMEVELPSDYFDARRKATCEYPDPEECMAFREQIVRELVRLREQIARLGYRIERMEIPIPVSAEVKVMTIEEAKPIVEEFLKNYLREHNEVYPSDIADELHLEYWLVREIFDILEKEEKLQQKASKHVEVPS